jgi:hypothetical protein
VSPLRPYRVVEVGWVLGRLAGKKVVYDPADVFPSQGAAARELAKRKKKDAKSGEA